MTVDRQEPAFQPYYASRVRSAYGHAMPPPMPSTAPVQPRWYSSPALLNLLADVLFLGAALAIAYVAVMWFLTRPLFPLREVVVLSPPAQVTREQVEYAAHGSVRGNFFLVDLEGVREAFEKLPWVRRAEVRRSWPNALEVRLEEHQAIAYWTDIDSEDAHLLNRQGEVFVAASNADMPWYSGPQGSAQHVLARFGEFNRALEGIGRHIVGLTLSARLAWQLELDNGMVIMLGRDSENVPVDVRLAQFVQAWPEAVQRLGTQVAVADLRYQSGFALTPEPPQQPVKGK